MSPANVPLQAGALVHIYTDGTVLVTHGGVEMGQGLHTKMAQIAAAALGLPLSAVYIAETATDKVPNASPTAASASSDIYGGAGNISEIRGAWLPKGMCFACSLGVRSVPKLAPVQGRIWVICVATWRSERCHARGGGKEWVSQDKVSH